MVYSSYKMLSASESSRLLEFWFIFWFIFWLVPVISVLLEIYSKLF